ncbi:MAG: nitrite reductase small subunit NirD [Cellvibrionaceae bacterium]
MEAVVNSAIVNEKTEWLSVCNLNDITPDTGVCVLFNGEQVAIFRERKNNQIFAISNYDPIGEANVLSRGILGSIDGQLVVASPLYKQHFTLSSGVCLEDDGVKVKTYPVRVEEGRVQLSL